MAAPSNSIRGSSAIRSGPRGGRKSMRAGVLWVFRETALLERWVTLESSSKNSKRRYARRGVPPRFVRAHAAIPYAVPADRGVSEQTIGAGLWNFR
jgi:hypothetical protein